MKKLTKLVSLALLSVMLLAGCTNKAQVSTTKTTNDNTKATTSSSTDNTQTNTNQPTASTNTTETNTSSTDLSNLNADSKKIYDIIVAKYPTATLLSDDEKKLIDDYVAKYSAINNHKAKDDEEYKNQTIYVNTASLSENYKRYSELKSSSGDKSVIEASQKVIDRILHDVSQLNP